MGPGMLIDPIVQIMLSRIAMPKYAYFCYQDMKYKTVEDCGKCGMLDEEGHCDCQNPINFEV